MITSEFPTTVATFITRDMQILIKNGYSIDLYALYPKDESLWDYVPKEGMKLIEDGHLKVKHISKMQMILSLLFFWNYFSLGLLTEVREILKQSKSYGSSQWQKSLYTVIWSIALISQEKEPYDKVISYWGNYSATGAYLFSKYAKVETEFYTYLHAGVDLYRDQIYLFEKLVYTKGILTVCQFNVEFLKQLYPDSYKAFLDKITVYHLPLEIKVLKPVKKEKNKIIAVGRLDKKKGVNYLVDACHILKKQEIDFSLTLIGKGPEQENLEKQILEYDLSKYVKFLGHLPYSEVEKEMSSSVVLAHCSPELGDAVPTVIKESLSLGTPVIGSNIVGIPELLDYGKCGILFEPKDTQSLAESLSRILSDTNLQEEMSVKGRKFAEDTFDIKKNDAVLLQAIGDTLVSNKDKNDLS